MEMDLLTAERLFVGILQTFHITGILPASDREILRRCAETFGDNWAAMRDRGSRSEYLESLACSLVVRSDGSLDWALECLPVSVMAEICQPCGHLVEGE